MSSTTKPHMLATPVFLWGFRLAQLVLALVVLGLSAYGITFLAFDGDSLMLFTALATMIVVTYVGVATLFAPVIYNYWAILGLDVFAIIFWLISFPLLASEIASYSGTTYDYCYYYCYRKDKRYVPAKRAVTTVETYRNAMIADAAIGGIEFVLFVVTLVVTSIHLHRHRKAGGHCVPASGAPATFEESKPAAQPPAQYQAQMPEQQQQTAYQTPIMQQPQAEYQAPVMQQPQAEYQAPVMHQPQAQYSAPVTPQPQIMYQDPGMQHVQVQQQPHSMQ
ncbi:hypothetical protein BP5796_01935 [Coleophoma crateriformis]|uniref:MARVEL domain-containing protein n=1 Tax=Coleophoma crateriformis TaxID=565419 RepID=A0A3D8T285_9HELO|nr:hypothetical protein BP5796_01935 [Coleophoma crateriformis]